MEQDEEIKQILACCAYRDFNVCLTNCPLGAKEGCIEWMAAKALARIERLEDELAKIAPAVRCQDCNWAYRVRAGKNDEGRLFYWRCGKPSHETVPNGYCHRGERKGERNAVD